MQNKIISNENRRISQPIKIERVSIKMKGPQLKIQRFQF